MGGPRWVARRTLAVLTVCALMGMAVALPAARAPVEELEGRGRLAVVTCIACIGGLTFSARGTLLGFLVNTWLYPDATAACAYVCYQAAS